MGSFKLHGKFRPGFRRFKAAHFGNDCLLFYPTSMDIPPTKVPAYKDVEEYLVGGKLTGQSYLGRSVFRHRMVSHLAPDEGLDPIFHNGQKNLIPAVFCHGLGANNEDHFGVCMQLASAGYMVASLNFIDGTAACSRDA